MPYNKNGGGPWGGNGDDDDRPADGGRSPWGSNQPGNRPGQGTGVPDIDRIVRKGQEQLRVLMGGRTRMGGNGGLPPEGPGGLGRGAFGLIGLALAALWAFASFYSVKPEEKSVELFFGRFSSIGEPGLNFAPWPVITKEIIQVTNENIEDIGVGRDGNDSGLMLTGDENIVDIDFQVVWNVSDPQTFLFNLAEPNETIRAVSESAMREVIGRSDLAPILNRDRAAIGTEVEELIQTTLNNYQAGVNIVRLNLDRIDPPAEVIDAFRDVQAAEQERDTLEKQADAYANRALAEARGRAAQLLQEAEAYRAQVVNLAEGEASRFEAVYGEYAKASDVTRKRLYIETMERVLAGIDKIIIDDSVSGSGQGVVPYLPLNELRRPGAGQ
jgi:membrane protease subunit HflK